MVIKCPGCVDRHDFINTTEENSINRNNEINRDK